MVIIDRLSDIGIGQLGCIMSYHGSRVFPRELEKVGIPYGSH